MVNEKHPLTARNLATVYALLLAKARQHREQRAGTAAPSDHDDDPAE